MNKYFMPIYTTVVGIIIGWLATWLKTLISKKKKKQDVENGIIDSLCDGMAILLRRQLFDYYSTYEYQDSIPMSEWQEIEETHNVYKKLHGNHSGDRVYEEMKHKHVTGG